MQAIIPCLIPSSPSPATQMLYWQVQQNAELQRQKAYCLWFLARANISNKHLLIENNVVGLLLPHLGIDFSTFLLYSLSQTDSIEHLNRIIDTPHFLSTLSANLSTLLTTTPEEFKNLCNVSSGLLDSMPMLAAARCCARYREGGGHTWNGAPLWVNWHALRACAAHNLPGLVLQVLTMWYPGVYLHYPKKDPLRFSGCLPLLTADLDKALKREAIDKPFKQEGTSRLFRQEGTGGPDIVSGMDVGRSVEGDKANTVVHPEMVRTAEATARPSRTCHPETETAPAFSPHEDACSATLRAVDFLLAEALRFRGCYVLAEGMSCIDALACTGGAVGALVCAHLGRRENVDRLLDYLESQILAKISAEHFHLYARSALVALSLLQRVWLGVGRQDCFRGCGNGCGCGCVVVEADICGKDRSSGRLEQPADIHAHSTSLTGDVSPKACRSCDKHNKPPLFSVGRGKEVLVCVERVLRGIAAAGEPKYDFLWADYRELVKAQDAACWCVCRLLRGHAPVPPSQYGPLLQHAHAQILRRANGWERELWNEMVGADEALRTYEESSRQEAV